MGRFIESLKRYRRSNDRGRGLEMVDQGQWYPRLTNLLMALGDQFEWMDQNSWESLEVALHQKTHKLPWSSLENQWETLEVA